MPNFALELSKCYVLCKRAKVRLPKPGGPTPFELRLCALTAMIIFTVLAKWSSTSRSYGCPISPDLPVAICLSVIPPRHARLEGVVRSLLDQSVHSLIYITLPTKYSRKFLERDIRNLASASIAISRAFSSVHVLRGTDFGPVSKLVAPLLNISEDTILVVVDDDQIYRKTMVCDLLMMRTRFPGAAITRRSRRFTSSCQSRVSYEGSVQQSDERSLLTRKIFFRSDIVMGTSGYLVESSFFSQSIFDFGACPLQARKDLFFNDDIWISAHLRRRQVEVVTALTGARVGDYRLSPPENHRQLSADDSLWKLEGREKARVGAIHAMRHIFCPNVLPSNSSCAL